MGIHCARCAPVNVTTFVAEDFIFAMIKYAHLFFHFMQLGKTTDLCEQSERHFC